MNFEMTLPEARALATYIELIRKRMPGDSWHRPGVEDALARARHRAPSPDLALAAISAATRPENRTPAIIGMDGPHWREASKPPRPEQLDDAGRCSVCSEAQERCRRLWPDDHEFLSVAAATAARLERNQDTRKRIVEAVKAEVVPTTEQPEPASLEDRLAALPPEKRDPRYAELRAQLREQADEPEVHTQLAAERVEPTESEISA